MAMKPYKTDVCRDKRDGFLEDLHSVLSRNHTDPAFGLSQMAAEMRISQRHLQRLVRELTGCSPAQYLRTYRLQQSRQRLLEGRSIGQVATSVGFTSQSYFASCFRTQFGVTPGEFQLKS